jgi:alkaline phosphatase D
MAKFGEERIRNMVAVGAVTAHTARLWFRTEVAGEHTVEVFGPDNRVVKTVKAVVPIDNLNDNTCAVDIDGLAAAQRHSYRIVRVVDGTPLGSGLFQTFPGNPAETPEVFSLAFMSCHQPFNSPDGTLSDRSLRMLRLAPTVLEQHDAKFVIMCGDQMYADNPGNYSLFDPHYTDTKVRPGMGSILEWPAAEVRRAYQQHYRTYYAVNELRRVYANYPCYPILDDHEIVDDWGSDPVHMTPKWANLRAGGMAAYHDYQGSRIPYRGTTPPASYHYDFDFGSTGVFVLDIRTQRDITKGQLYGQAQLDDLKAFLARHTQSTHQVIFIVASVPVVHIPEWLADVGAAIVGGRVDFPDHWAYKANVGARDALLQVLHDHQVANPKQKMALLSGDVHIGVGFVIHWIGDNKPILYQFTSSALSNRLKRNETFFSKLGPELVQTLNCSWGGSARTSLLRARGGGPSMNPFGGLNVGIVEVRKRGDHSTIRFKLVGYEPDKELEGHAVMFDSAEI